MLSKLLRMGIVPWHVFTDMRGLILILALIFLFLMGRNTWMEKTNRLIFNLEARLAEAPKAENKTVIVTLPGFDAQTLAQNPEVLPQFTRLLERLKHVKPAATAIIFDRMPRELITDPIAEVTARLSDIIAASDGKDVSELSDLLTIARGVSGPYGGLLKTIRTNDVIVGTRFPDSSTGADPIMDNLWVSWTAAELGYADSEKRTYLEWLPASAMPPAMPFVDKPLETGGLQSVLGEASLVYSGRPGSAARSMVWHHGSRYHPFLVTLLYGHLMKDPEPVWVAQEGLQFDSHRIRTDFSGRVNFLFLAGALRDQKVPQMTLREIASKPDLASLRNKIILIGRHGDETLREIALSVQSLETKFISHTPFWAIWLEKGMIILFCLYLVLILPRLQMSLGMVLSLLLAVVTITAQLGLHLIHGQWAPLAASLLFFFSGHVLMQIRQRHQFRLQKFEQKANEVSYKLGLLQFEQHQYDQAFESLKPCRPGKEVLELLFDIGIECERRLQYKKALDVFRFIHGRKKGFKDVAVRVARLPDLMDGTMGGVTGLNGSSTQDLQGFEIQQVILGRYQVERILGRGAMGTVYLGRDPKIGRSVAIKTLDFSQALSFDENFDSVKKRFFREAEAIGRLNHPNIVTIFDVGEEEDLAFIIMDYVEGETLNYYTQKKNLLPVATVFQLVRQVAEALDYAHQQNIIHRDIKPGNIIFNKEGKQVKVTDFGIARFMDTTRTATNAILGSPSFMSPEQLKRSSVDGRADIFSLGITFFLLLTGKFPFTGEDLASLTYQIANTKSPDVRTFRSKLPESASRIINKALQKKPGRRFKTAREMADALNEGLAKLPGKRKRKALYRKATAAGSASNG